MRITRIGYALGVAAAVAVFAGCSGNSSSLGPIAQGPTGSQSIVRNHPAIALPGAVIRQIHAAPQYTGKSWTSPDVTGTLEYVCTFYSGTCNFYKKGHNTVLGTIVASYPNGVCVDKNGNFWEPDGGTGHVFEFAKGGTAVIDDKDNTSNGQPSACAVDKNGTLYVANIVGDSISVYNVGASTPSRTLTDNAAIANGAIVVGISVDEHHLLALTWTNGSASGVDEFPNAHGHGVTKISITGDFIGGVTFDNAENLVVNLQIAGTSNVYNGTSFAQCNSFSSSTMGGDSVNGALNKANTSILESDATNTQAQALSYGGCSGGGTLQKTYNAGLPSGGVVIGVAEDAGQGV